MEISEQAKWVMHVEIIDRAGPDGSGEVASYKYVEHGDGWERIDQSII